MPSVCPILLKNIILPLCLIRSDLIDSPLLLEYFVRRSLNGSSLWQVNRFDFLPSTNMIDMKSPASSGLLFVRYAIIISGSVLLYTVELYPSRKMGTFSKKVSRHPSELIKKRQTWSILTDSSYI